MYIPAAKHVELASKYKGADLFNKEELMSDWYQNFTHIDEDFAVSEIQKLDDFIEMKNIQTGKNVG